MSNAEKILEPFQKIFAAMNISDSQIKLAAENFSLPELTDAERKDFSEGKESSTKKFWKSSGKNSRRSSPSLTRSTPSSFTSATNISHGKDTRWKIIIASTCASANTCAPHKKIIVTKHDTS